MNAPSRPPAAVSRRRWALPAIITAWSAALAIGVMRMMAYDYTPTPAAAAATVVDWPTNLPIDRSTDGRATLVVVLHPLCPCSKATVSELGRLLARVEPRLQTYAVFAVPTGLDLKGAADPRRNTLWQAAAEIPGVTNILDPGGSIAARFDARSSGQAYLYDADGRLLFAGGITTGRGLVGDNDGVIAIESLLRHPQRPDAPATTPVYGCSIR